MSLRRISMVMAVASLALSPGCKKDKKAPEPGTSETAQSVSSAPVDHQARAKARELMMGQSRRTAQTTSRFIQASLAAPELTEEQRTKIDGLSSRSKDAAVDMQSDEVRALMVQSAKSGKVDEEAFLKLVKDIDKQRNDQWLESLKELHGVLTEAQRASVAEEIRGQFAEEEEKKQAATEPAPPPKGPTADGPHLLPHTRLQTVSDARSNLLRHRLTLENPEVQSMTQGLELSEEQKKKVDEAFELTEASRLLIKEEQEAQQKRNRTLMLAAADAFSKESFDAPKVLGAMTAPSHDAWLKRYVDHLQKLLTLLTEEQRMQLAKKFETERVSPLPLPPMADSLFRPMRPGGPRLPIRPMDKVNKMPLRPSR